MNGHGPRLGDRGPRRHRYRADVTEQITPRQFHGADGVEDWRVLAFGACAYFRTGSFAGGVGARGLGPWVTKRDDQARKGTGRRSLVELRGVEPLTYCVQSSRSAN